jgi:hypothetical protein
LKNIQEKVLRTGSIPNGLLRLKENMTGLEYVDGENYAHHETP